MLIVDGPGAVGAIRLALRHAAGFKVVGTIDGRSSARSPLLELSPEVVLVDDMCQQTNAMARLREATGLAPDAIVVLLSGRMDSASLDDALIAGADAVISRGLHPATLGTLLREIVQGSVIHSPRRSRGEVRARIAANCGKQHSQRLAVVSHETPEARTIA